MIEKTKISRTKRGTILQINKDTQDRREQAFVTSEVARLTVVVEDIEQIRSLGQDRQDNRGNHEKPIVRSTCMRERFVWVSTVHSCYEWKRGQQNTARLYM